ncbi:NAD(P)-dependent dehydrogenase, short-chain alcohol dehydrogenase family [Variovorax sp. HW608]|uniref:SDR family NAD(P)-dependent oxidoreductase n=1 Tax=Variovorax sp. HW608 TaxID=1034889 RepID=UPI00081FF1A8|nr:SDR family NAD(P)-dependent oxidoreductase [Variovorax sp. HW608]SCK29151.1 NAD(P)-dependent dehydrogenase, short-chain alcohol dehydrogenase family [Variovorax sp. HW608]
MTAPAPLFLPERLPETPGLLAGRLALVTGAASGIGRAIAVAFARAGARVVVTDLDAGDCAATLAEVRAAGVAGWAHALDVSDAEACSALAATVAEQAGAVDTLVNNAGVLIREGIDSPRAAANLRRTFDVNLFGLYNTVEAWLPALRATRGSIINIASGAAFIAQGGCHGYSASKGAVKMATQTLALDLAPDGIRVNALAPGVIHTPMTEATRGDPARLQRFMQRIPAGRLGQPHELAGPAVFLASGLASFVTGVTLPVDGGTLAV